MPQWVQSAGKCLGDPKGKAHRGLSDGGDALWGGGLEKDLRKGMEFRQVGRNEDGLKKAELPEAYLGELVNLCVVPVAGKKGRK